MWCHQISTFKFYPCHVGELVDSFLPSGFLEIMGNVFFNILLKDLEPIDALGEVGIEMIVVHLSSNGVGQSLLTTENSFELGVDV